MNHNVAPVAIVAVAPRTAKRARGFHAIACVSIHQIAARNAASKETEPSNVKRHSFGSSANSMLNSGGTATRIANASQKRAPARSVGPASRPAHTSAMHCPMSASAKIGRYIGPPSQVN
ncbi:MAG: hypothetical protein NVV63_02780 [Opitutus sp.]|nr:hypothetical protein [Opitutus sp.]